MAIKMQQGGDPGVAAQLQDPTQSVLGIFSQMNMTNPEAQRWAREYLEDFESYDWTTEEELLQQRRDVAEESRQALINARQQVLGTQYDERDRWLAAAQAFGTPTRTGQFGEELGNVAGALREPFRNEEKFEREKREQLLELQGAIGGIDESLLESEFGLQSLRRGQELGLAKEAAKIMGKTVQASPRTILDSTAIKSLDAKMATRYTDWVTGGQEFMVAKQALLADAIVKLQTEGGLSGEWEGLIPKMAKDIFLPQASNVQEVIETVAQESLKKILGGQFGQREGEMLLERTFNPRLPEHLNARRAQNLLTKLQRATDEERRAMRHFEDYGTMAGYEGKTDWSILDFLPDPIMIDVVMPDGKVIEVPNHWKKPDVMHYHLTGEEPVDPLLEMMERQGLKEGGRVRRKRARYAQGGTVRGYAKKAASPRNLKYYQAGGEVEDDEEKEKVDFEDLDEPESTRVGFEDYGEEPASLLELGVTVAGGTAAGLAAEELGTRAYEKVADVERPPRSQQLIGEAMEVSNVTPEEARLATRRSRRGRTPAVLLDESGRVTQKLGERAMIAAGRPGDVALDMLEERFATSSERVGVAVEKGLRTPEFHSTEQKLTDRLYSRAKPLYEQAYKEGEKMPWPKYWSEWMDRPYSQQAIDIATEFMAAEGKLIGGAPDATGYSYSTSLEFLDQLKRGFDQIIRTEESGSGPTPRSRIMKKQRAQLIRYLDNNAPEAYKKARAQYKGDLEVLEALDIGRREFHRLDPEEARLLLSDMDWSETGALRTGVAQRIYDMIYNPSGDIAAAKRLLGSKNMRLRLQLLFDKPADWRVFEAALDREMKMFSDDRAMRRRVDTGRAGRQLGEVMAMDDPLRAAKDMMGRGPIMWALRTVGWGRRAGGLTEQQADEIVEILTNRDLKELDRYTPQLEYAQDYARTRRGRRGKAALVGTGVGLALAGAKAFGADEEEDEEPYDEQDIESLKEALGIEEE